MYPLLTQVCTHMRSHVPSLHSSMYTHEIPCTTFCTRVCVHTTSHAPSLHSSVYTHDIPCITSSLKCVHTRDPVYHLPIHCLRLCEFSSTRWMGFPWFGFVSVFVGNVEICLQVVGSWGFLTWLRQVLGKTVPSVSCDLRCQEVRMVKVKCASLSLWALFETMRKVTGMAPGELCNSTVQ